MNQRLSLVLAADHAFALPLGTTLVSLLRHKANETALEIFILDNGLLESDREKLNTIIAPYSKVSLQYQPIAAADLEAAPEKRHLKKATYSRLLAPSLIDRPRLLYLDSDLIINSDLTPLFQTDLGEKTIAAAPDAIADYVVKYFFRPLKCYFNAGVLLIDTKRWQENQISERALVFIEANPEKIRYADQDVLNHLLEDDWQVLDKSWNYQLDRDERPGRENAKIFHFVGPRKPWQYLYHNSYKKFFLAALQASPWKEYQFPDRTPLNIFRKNIYEPLFVFIKEFLKANLPPSAKKRLKEIFWAIVIKRDNK